MSRPKPPKRPDVKKASAMDQIAEMLRAGLDKEFQTIHYSKRAKDPVTVHKMTEKFWNEESDKALHKIPHQIDIGYVKGDNEHQKLDIFGTQLPENAPIFVFVPGGLWVKPGRTTCRFVAEQFNRHNIKTAIIGYRLAPHAKLENICEDVYTAIDYVLDYAVNNHSSGVYLSGHSCGAHLLTCFLQHRYPQMPAVRQDAIKCVYLFSGIYDITRFLKMKANATLFMFTEEDVQERNPITFTFGANSGPLYQHIKFRVIVTENDSPAITQQGKAFMKHLKNKMTQCDMIEVPHHDHFQVIEDLTKEDYQLTKLIMADITQLLK